MNPEGPHFTIEAIKVIKYFKMLLWLYMDIAEKIIPALLEIYLKICCEQSNLCVEGS